MRWFVRDGDILDIPADILVCSANVYLTLSGGVGGALLSRYGPAMQDSLREYLATRNIRHVNRGDIVVMPSCGTPYKAVLHAVAVDGFYETSVGVIATVLKDSLRRCAELQATDVAMTALATGYGRMAVADFANALRGVVNDEFPSLQTVTIGLRSQHDVDDLVSRNLEITRAK